MIRKYLGIMVLLCIVSDVHGADKLKTDFSSLQDSVFYEVVETYNRDQAEIYSGLAIQDKATFLTSFWSQKNPLVLKYYHNVLLGQKHISVDESFWDQMQLIPKAYKVEVASVDSHLVRNAIEVCQKIDRMMPDDPIVLNALGYLMLEKRDGVAADDYFLRALKKDKRLVAARQGRGLAHLVMPLKVWASKKIFEEALPWDKKYEAAFYNQAMCHVVLRTADTGRHFKQLLKRFPNHRQGHYKYGVFLETQGKLEDAEAEYRKQLVIQPNHSRASLRLGLIAFKQDKFREAVEVINQHLQFNPKLKRSLLPILFEAHLGLGDMVGADTTAMAYLQVLDKAQRSLFEDIQFVASPEELRAYEQLSESERGNYIRAFWQQRDPTPATPENEWLIEHIRRVIYARRHFLASDKPWDRRGEIYIRYGAPDHVSRSDHIRFETMPDVVRVKDQLWDRLSLGTRIEIVARIQRLRTSDKDVQYYRGGVVAPEVFDFEGIENAPRSGREHASSPDKKFFNATPVSQRDQGFGTELLRGYPTFPIASGKAWEYWIYPEINGGIEIVFTSDVTGGDYDLPDLPLTRHEDRAIMRQMLRYRPEHVIASAISASPTLYRFEYEPLEFAFASATFKGENGKSRLEVYYGLDEIALEDSVELGVAVFDSTWTPVVQRVEDWDGNTLAQAGVYVDELMVDVAPGQYFLGVQMKKGKKLSDYKTEQIIDDYHVPTLTLSDIELAAEIVLGDSSSVKDGLQVVPLPSKALRQGQSLKIYYELYGLMPDGFGQTHYKVNYTLQSATGGTPIVRVLRALGKPLGLVEDKSFSVAYEQTGNSDVAKQYLEVDVSASSSGAYRLVITATDLETDLIVNKDVTFQIVD